MLPSHAQNLKIGSVGRFFFLRTVRELSFPIYFLKVSKWWKTRAECSQNAYTSAFLSHLIQILANSSPKSDIFYKKKKKKKNDPVFFAFYGRSDEGNITHFFWPYTDEKTIREKVLSNNFI